ncbi:cytochrome P450 2J6 [Trichonephila inaurata madagascariensis]|uniref:Cytochrome P450 2J6 n=1 Tax=Trichonephila inaurata madagascariensis TaxID=2747483 RepID=A0A8X7BXI8_9ARAC|nr:cytochrome P450 2J6 [Trichonephila inaurata madagascariensis]
MLNPNDMLYDRDMLSILLGSFFIILCSYWWYSKRRYKLPPGPWGVPFIGYFPFLGDEPFKTLLKLTEKYGSVYSINFNGSYTIILNDFESVREAFNNPAVSDRPPNLFDFHPDGLGFTGYSGPEWMEQRRYTLKVLRDIEREKIPWESNLEAEVEDLIRFLEEKGGQPTDMRDPISVSVSSNITSIILGKRLPKGDPRRTIVDNGVKAVMRTFSQLTLVTFFPRFMQFVARLGLSSFAEEFQKMLSFNKLIRTEIKCRKEIPSAEQNEEIFIDGYLQEMQKLEEKGVKTYFNEKNLVSTAQTLVIGGSDPTRAILEWLFLAMSYYPEIQKKIHKEIDDVMGKDGRLNWTQRMQVPYTYASTLEVLRWKTIAPLGAPHRVSEDTTIGGYHIPKGTDVMSNIYALHNDSKYWEDPEIFKPERFLHKDGSTIMRRLDSYAPFSIGRRICPGEMITMMEIFHYFTAVLQKFDIRPAENASVILEGMSGATYQAVPQKLRFISRN